MIIKIISYFWLTLHTAKLTLCNINVMKIEHAAVCDQFFHQTITVNSDLMPQEMFCNINIIFYATTCGFWIQTKNRQHHEITLPSTRFLFEWRYIYHYYIQDYNCNKLLKKTTIVQVLLPSICFLHTIVTHG